MMDRGAMMLPNLRAEHRQSRCAITVKACSQAQWTESFRHSKHEHYCSLEEMAQTITAAAAAAGLSTTADAARSSTSHSIGPTDTHVRRCVGSHMISASALCGWMEVGRVPPRLGLPSIILI